MRRPASGATPRISTATRSPTSAGSGDAASCCRRHVVSSCRAIATAASLSPMAIESEALGRAAYAGVLARMQQLHARVRARELAGRVLFVEHEPVYTAGR